MSKEKQLVKNTFLYALGNIGSKVLTILTVPLYTYYINTSDMGVYDVILTVVSLVYPVVICSIHEGVYRWIIQEPSKAGQYIRFGIKLEIRNLFIISILYFVVINFISIPYFGLIWGVVITTCLSTFVHRATRALGNTRLFSFCGIIYTIVYLSLNVVLITKCDLGISSLLISIIVGNIICTIPEIIVQWKDFSLKTDSIDKKEAKKIVKYSFGLIPNDICWWLVGMSGRIILLTFVAASANGIYSISQKFPTVVTMFTSIFYMAWQDQAISGYSDNDKNKYYSKIFNSYYKLLFCGILCLIPLTKYFILWFMEESYHDAWRFVAPIKAL